MERNWNKRLTSESLFIKNNINNTINAQSDTKILHEIMSMSSYFYVYLFWFAQYYGNVYDSYSFDKRNKMLYTIVFCKIDDIVMLT